MSTIAQQVQKVFCKKMAFFQCEQATKRKYSILCIQLKQHTIHSLKKEALRVGFQERPCYTPAVTLLHTQNTTCEQLQRQQLMKWSDGVLSEDAADKKKKLCYYGDIWTGAMVWSAPKGKNGIQSLHKTGKTMNRYLLHRGSILPVTQHKQL